MDEHDPLSNQLSSALASRGLSFKHLLEETGVPDMYLEALLGGEYEKLPAAPYVRGYLKKIGPALSLDGEELWAKYKEEVHVHASGPTDNLPSNRFALKSRNTKHFIWAGVVLLLLVIYFLVNKAGVLGTPDFSIEYPREAFSLSRTPAVILEGSLGPSSKLFINGELLHATEGAFEKRHVLEPGINTLQFTAKKFLGREVSVTRQILYESAGFEENTSLVESTEDRLE